MSSSEIAAWVQAVGSVAAIFVAIAVANKQFKDGIKLQQEIARAERVRRYEAIRGLIEAALEESAQVLVALRSTDPAKWFDENSGLEAMGEFHLALQQISPLEMPSYVSVRSLIKFRDLMAIAIWNTKAALEHGTKNYEGYTSCVAALEHNLAEIRSEHENVLAELAQTNVICV